MKHEWRFYVRTDEEGIEIGRGQRCAACQLGVQFRDEERDRMGLVLESPCRGVVKDHTFATIELRDAAFPPQVA